VDKQTLAIVSSYSGNTEETISAFRMIEKTGAKIIVISSGGKLIKAAKQKKYDYVQVPGNWPSPRACLGFSMVAQLAVLQKLGIISDKSMKSVARSIKLINKESSSIKRSARSIAKIASSQ